jgi:cytochrome c556
MLRSLRFARLAAFALIATTALSAAAQFRKPEEAIAYRQGAMTVMGIHFYRAARMASGRAPFDAKALASDIDIATYLSKLPFAGFVEGSDKGETRALPKIWTEMDKFRASATKMQDEMAKLNVVAKSGNIELIKAQVDVTNKACKSCHESYQKE